MSGALDSHCSAGPASGSGAPSLPNEGVREPASRETFPGEIDDTGAGGSTEWFAALQPNAVLNSEAPLHSQNVRRRCRVTTRTVARLVSPGSDLLAREERLPGATLMRGFAGPVAATRSGQPAGRANRGKRGGPAPRFRASQHATVWRYWPRSSRGRSSMRD